MNLLPRSVSPRAARGGLAACLAVFAALAAWTADDLRGQTPPKKPRDEQMEEPGKTKPKKVIRVEDEDDPKTKPGTPAPAAPAGADLQQLARQAAHPALKELFGDLAFPHDIVVSKRSSVTSGGKAQREENVEPIPTYLGSDPVARAGKRRLQLQPLSDDGKREKAYFRNVDSMLSVLSYEELAQDKVRRYLQDATYSRRPEGDPRYLSETAKLTAAEQVLTAVLRWHESAVQTGQRSGTAWEPIGAGLRKQLLDEVLLKQMETLAAAKDWDQVLALTRRLMSSYPNPADQARILRPVADLIDAALKDPDGSDDKKQVFRKRLHELYTAYPDNAALRPLADALRKQAQSLIDRARELDDGKNDSQKLQQMTDLLRQAKEVWPESRELRAAEMRLGTEHPVLKVGVRGPLPKYLSPDWACTDAERRAVELLFEGLVKLVPDDAGGFVYRPGLAEFLPRVVPLGRQFRLPRNAAWSDGGPLNAADVRYTIELLRRGKGAGRSRVWGELIDSVEVKNDPFLVTLRLRQGYLDPVALMTFKVLPRERPVAVDSERFAQEPVCSGPYRPDPERRADEKGRPCLVFVANPSYALRAGKRGLPRIQEVRFYSYSNPVTELADGKLDLALDLTADDADKLRQQADRFGLEVPLPSKAVPNRRVYFLAVNNKKLADPALRKALAHAINREELLDRHFRGPLKDRVHKAINGPFPFGSWAANPALTGRQNRNSLDLYDPLLVQSLKVQPAVRQAIDAGGLTLKYPEGDRVLADAMKELCEQVKKATGVPLEPTPCNPYALRQDVEQTQSYDLAYYHYDFPDETYWLWPLLGAPPRPDADSNWFRYSGNAIQVALKDAMSYRNFAEVQRHLRLVHESLLGEMPLIPLWQLDPLLAHHRSILPAGLDPVLVFPAVEEWTVRRK